MAGTEQLYLPDLAIRGFRGIDNLSMPRLGRVTLLTGKNSVGKTTVLDAVRVYASGGDYPVVRDLLRDREELSAVLDENGGRVLEADWSALFHGWDAAHAACISIGNSGDQLSIDTVLLSEEESPYWARHSRSFPTDDVRALRVAFRGRRRVLPCLMDRDGSSIRNVMFQGVRPRRLIGDDEPSPRIDCESMGPGLTENEAMARYWDQVALTDDEERAVGALRIVLGGGVDRVAVIGDDRAPGLGGRRRRAVVKLEGQDRPVPLKSLGDGALRLFGIALALANSRDGFLLIDEAENGIHHSVQRDLWTMVLQTAHENNVQVLATTHSWDCVRGFAQAATENEHAEGVLVRIDRDDAGLRAVEYSEEDLRIAAEQGIEVR